MATVTTVTAARPGAWQAARPSFLGLMRGEWLKISRQWSFWIMVALMVGGFILYALLFQGNHLADRVANAPLNALAAVVETPLFLVRVFWGMMMIILTARLIGMEYSGGTARIILARGVGRLNLLFAKLSVIALIALGGAVVFLAFAGALELLDLQATVGNLNLFQHADPVFWADARAYALSVLVSLVVSILLAAGITSVTRSLAIGLPASVLWFPIDNLSIILLYLAIRLTKWSFWPLLSGDFLGLNLNAMGQAVMSDHTPLVLGSFSEPLTPVTGAHTLLVAAIYGAVALAAAVGVTALRDVRE